MRACRFNKKIIIAVVCIILLFALILSSTFLGILYYKPSLDEPVRIIAYFTSNSVNEYADLTEYDFSRVTHLIYAFAHIDATTVSLYVENENGLEMLSSYLSTNYPNVKLMLSIGTSQNNDGMCVAAHTQNNLARIVEQCNELMKRYILQGFDVDWEYPNFSVNDAPRCSDCVSDHATLLEFMRNGLPKDTILSIAGAGAMTIADGLKNARLSKVLDFVNVMLYDMGMRRHSSIIDSKSMMFHYQLCGYSKKQLNWGVPFYGRCEKSEYDYFDYSHIMSLIESGDAELVQKNNFSHAVYNGSLISFDTKLQIKRKAECVKKYGYGGVFCWHLKCDRDNELMATLWETLRD